MKVPKDGDDFEDEAGGGLEPIENGPAEVEFTDHDSGSDQGPADSGGGPGKPPPPPLWMPPLPPLASPPLGPPADIAGMGFETRAQLEQYIAHHTSLEIYHGGKMCWG